MGLLPFRLMGEAEPNRIDRIFSEARANGRRLLMPFLCADHPSVGSLGELLPALEAGGASIVEIGIPFSDPIADGPVIAAAMHAALAAGSTPAGVFEQVAGVRARTNLGLVAMVSVSLVYGMGGPARFAALASEAGFDGFIFPDAPLEESAELTEAARERGLTASLLVAPTTPPERAARIAEASSGFLYLLARGGITGERSDAPEIGPRVAMLRERTRLPIACGFGVSTPEHVRAVVEHADAAIVGSALVRRLAQAREAGADVPGAARAFAAELAAGLASAAAA